MESERDFEHCLFDFEDINLSTLVYHCAIINARDNRLIEDTRHIKAVASSIKLIH